MAKDHYAINQIMWCLWHIYLKSNAFNGFYTKVYFNVDKIDLLKF